MITRSSGFTTFAQTSTGKRAWDAPSLVSASDGQRAIVPVDENANPSTWNFETEALIATGLSVPPPARARRLLALRVRVERTARHLAAGPFVDGVADLAAGFHMDGSLLGDDLAAPGEWPDGDTVAVYTLDDVALATAGIDLSILRHPAFGFRLSAQKPGTSDPIQPEIDRVSLEYDFETLNPLDGGEETMDHYTAGKQGGFEAVLSEAFPDLSTSTAMFANAPARTAMIEVSPVGEDLIIRWGAGQEAATAAPEGNVYAAGGTYRFPVNQSQALVAKAIQNAPSCVGWITYWGLA